MRSRVMPGSSPTIERRECVSRLKSVDFPTLGRPTIATSGSCELAGVEGTTDLWYFDTKTPIAVRWGKRHPRETSASSILHCLRVLGSESDGKPRFHSGAGALI